jgi:hypothetical protein
LAKYGVRSDGIVEDADVVSGTLGTTYCTPSIFKLSYFNFSLLTSIFWSMRTYSLNRNHQNEHPYHVLNPTNIDSHKLATKIPVGLNDTTATNGTEFMCNALGSENIGLQAIVARMKDDVLYFWVDEKIPVAGTNGTVARVDFMIGQRGHTNGEDYIPTMAVTTVGCELLGVGGVHCGWDEELLT